MKNLDALIGRYLSEGLSFIPIPFKSKVPAIEWKQFQTTRPTESQVKSWFNGHDTNIAVICGQVSGGLVVLDFDTKEGFDKFYLVAIEKIGLDLLDFTRVSRTARGYHVWVKVTEPVKNQKYPALDVKSDGGYIIAPPSVHPDGPTYELMNPDVSINTIRSLSDIGIDVTTRQPIDIRSKQMSPGSELLRDEQIPQGNRNQTLASLGGGMRRKGMSQVAIEAALQVENRERCQPPLPEEEVVKIAKSVATYLPVPSNGLLIKNNIQTGGVALYENSFAGGQVSGQVVDKLENGERGYGDLAAPFDQYLSDNPEPHYKREVAEIIGTTYKDPAFIKLVQRRKRDGQIRIISGGDKIQWINKAWQNSIIQLDAVATAFTNLVLPFGAEKYIAIPEHSQIVTAGDIGSGKTHWGYLLAELNVGKMPIRHFFNEIGASKAKRNLEDFPNLLRHYGHDYFLIDLDKDGLDVAENLDPNGLNIYDYMHLTSSKEWFLVLQQELTRLSQGLEKGVICVMLQKKQGAKQAMGGDVTRMQCEVYFTLNIEHNQNDFKECRVDVDKAKDWLTNTNPETLCCRYKTAPKYGKLLNIGGWERKPQV